jgi:anti-sigma28 factor (negative regulator of flagellin synthesis)
MSSINGVGDSLPIQKITTKPVYKEINLQPTRPPDKVELSGTSPLDNIKAGEIRFDKVAEVRQQIEAGTYETATRLHSAIDKLL